LVVALGACGGRAPQTSGRADDVRVVRVGGVQARVPAGWHVRWAPLTGVVSPVQRLVVSSFAIPPGLAGGCAPSKALAAMPPGGGLLFMFEYRGPTRHDLDGVPARPAHFRLDRRTLLPYECLGRSYMVRFRDHRRVLQAHVYLGRRAGSGVRRAILAVLDSLRIAPPAPRSAAVWVPPRRVLARAPTMGVACPRPNRFACDRVGLAVWLRRPAVAVEARIGERPLRLDDAEWSGALRHGRRRMFAGFLQPAGLLAGPLRLHADDGPGRWVGHRAVRAGVELLIERSPRRFVRTSLSVPLAAGWG
jgi:hypothetical protein